jgi:hypothetical protein
MKKKTKRFDNGGSTFDPAELVKNLRLSGQASKSDGTSLIAGRVGYHQPLDDDSSIDFGVSGHRVKGKNFSDKNLDAADLRYFKKLDDNSSMSADLGYGRGEGINRAGVKYTKKFKQGGKVSSASNRGDGIAQRGKTKGKFV